MSGINYVSGKSVKKILKENKYEIIDTVINLFGGITNISACEGSSRTFSLQREDELGTPLSALSCGVLTFQYQLSTVLEILESLKYSMLKEKGK